MERPRSAAGRGLSVRRTIGWSAAATASRTAPNNTGWYDGPFAYNMGAFTLGTQVQPYGTNPNGIAGRQLLRSGCQPAHRASRARIRRPRSSTARAASSSTSTTNIRRASTCGTYSWNGRSRGRGSSRWATRVRTARICSSRERRCRTISSSRRASSRTAARPTSVRMPRTIPAPRTCRIRCNRPGSTLPFVGTIAQSTHPVCSIPYYPYLALLGDSVQRDQGWSDYNSLQACASGIPSPAGLQVDGNYTWSKATDNGYTELQDLQGFSDNVGSGGGWRQWRPRPAELEQ